MRNHRGKIKQLEKALTRDKDYVELPDGSKHYFTEHEAARDVFTSEMGIGRAAYFGRSHVEFSLLIQAVANATEESRERFIQRHGDPFKGPTIVERRGPWVRFEWCELDGTVRTELIEGEEAATWFEASHLPSSY